MNQRDLFPWIVGALFIGALFLSGLETALRWIDAHREQIVLGVLGVIALAGVVLIAWAYQRRRMTGSMQADCRFWMGCALLAFCLVGLAADTARDPWLNSEPRVVPVVFPSPTPH